MVSRTRRALLGCSAALLATVAGCNSRLRDTPTETADVEPGSVTGPKFIALRRSGSDPPVTVSSADGTVRSAIVASADGADRLAYAPDVDAGAARTFVAETAFGTESIVVESIAVDECDRLELCAVSWDRGGVEAGFVRVLRDADVPCRVDASSSLTTLIRVPAVLDPDAMSVRSFVSDDCSHFGSDTSPGGTGVTPVNAATPADRTRTDDARDGEDR